VLETLLSHLPSIWTAITGLLGGGAAAALIKAYQTYFKQKRKNDAQDHEQDLELSEHLETRLTKVAGRLDAAESELRTTKQELSRARIREDELTAAVDALVDRVDRLLDRLEQHEQITEEERDRLTSPPYVERTSDNSSPSNNSSEHASS